MSAIRSVYVRTEALLDAPAAIGEVLARAVREDPDGVLAVILAPTRQQASLVQGLIEGRATIPELVDGSIDVPLGGWEVEGPTFVDRHLLESFRFRGLTVLELDEAIYTAKAHGWRPKAEADERT